jgi:hypothetical protein
MNKYLAKSSKIIAALTIGLMLINCSADSGGSDSVTPPAPVQKTKYTVSIIAATGGAVSTAGGSYDQGQTFSVTATASNGYVFSSWSDGNTNATRTITVSSNTNLTANFTVVVDPPKASSLSFPENDKVCQEGTSVSDTESSVNFQWSASEKTTAYDLIINDIEANTSETYSDITETNKEVTLERAKSYSWQIISKSNETTETATSDLWQFYLAGDGEENFAPYPATIVAPASGSTATATDGLVTLQWTGEDPDEDTLTYTVYIDTVDGLQDANGTITDLTVTETTYQVTSNTVYYWRVKSSDGQNSSFTQVYTFRVE